MVFFGNPSSSFVALLCCAWLYGVHGFSSSSVDRSSNMKMSSSSSSNNNNSRRNFLERVAGTTTAIVAGTTLSTSSPALAVGGQKKVNAKLTAYGFPPAVVPDGLTPLCHLYGKGANRFPVLVTFSHPFDWVVTLPSNDVNGEDGTVQAGEYGTGDTATFFIDTAPGNVKDITSKPREFFQETLIKAISQKSNNAYQNFKVTKFEETTSPVKFGNQKYMIVDFKYDLLTGAGFEVDRRGIASVTSSGDAVEVLWCAATRQRYNKKLEPVLRNIASSFRCYTEGLKNSNELINNYS